MPRAKKVRSEDKQMKVRMMLPMTVRCNVCGTFMYKGTKFNTRMEDVRGETYLGIKIFRFYYRCTHCSAEFCMKTDPKNADYQLEAGATRNYEPWREKEKVTSAAVVQREEEEKGNAMKALENRTLDSRREMDILNALDEMKSLKARHERVDTEAAIAALKRSAAAEETVDLAEEDEKAVRQMLLQRAGFVRRLSDSDEDDAAAAAGGGAAAAARAAGASGAAGGRPPTARMRGAAVAPAAAALWDEELSEASEDTGIDGDAFMQQQFAAARAAAVDAHAGGGAAAAAQQAEQADGGDGEVQGGAAPASEQQQRRPAAAASAAAAKPKPVEKPPPALPKFGARPVAVVVKRKAEGDAAGGKPAKQAAAAAGGGSDSDGSAGGGMGGLLAGYGSSMVDNVLGEPASAALRAEVAALRGSMHKNCTHLVAGGATGLLEKEHVWEAELMLAATQALAPLAAQLQNDATLRVMLSVLMLELSLQSQAIKLQWNAGGGWGGPFAEKEGEGHGGCFPMHFDTDSSLDTRRVTTIWYLNPGWRPGDGGELRVYPFPQSPVDIAPLNDRMVLFSSQRMLHRVLPSQAERYCFTIWLSEGGARRPGGAPASGSDGGGLGGGGGAVQRQRAELRRALATDQPLGTEEAWHLARHPELFKHAVKWLFRAEWERSLRESHPAGPALEQALAQFRREIGVMERALAPLLPALAAGPPAGGLPPLACSELRPDSRPPAEAMAQPAGAGLSLEQDYGGDEEAMYKSDAFRMSCMKVLPCSKRFVHDWTECPFAHPQEKARRRDPRVHNYTGIACPSMKKEGCCAFGDHCPYAHNVFEYWLHPTRYRTQLCNDGSNCKRKICFFAHSLDELRVPACKPFVSPEALAGAAASAAADAEAKRKAATVGSPLSAFASLSPSPQRSPMDALRAAQAEASARLSSASMAGPASPSTTDESAAALGSSPADAAVHAALQQLSGAGFSSQEQQVIELVTSLLAQDKVSAEQAASILQQMLPSDALSHLQAHLSTPRASRDLSEAGRLSDSGRYSDPRSESGAAGVVPRSGYEPAQAMGSPRVGVPQAFSLEQVAAMQAAQNMGINFPSGGMPLGAQMSGGAPGLEPRMSMDSMRSSFDTARMSFDQAGLGSRGGSLDLMGTPRASLDAAYPGSMMPSYSGSYSGQFYSGQLSSVPEQFPMINAPAPTPSWNGAGRYSFDSAADRLSQDMQRMSFDAAARVAPQPTANPYASSFFAAEPAQLSAPAATGMAERRALSLPPLLTPVRTSAPAKNPGLEEREALDAAAAAQQQLLGGTVLHRLQPAALLCIAVLIAAACSLPRCAGQQDTGQGGGTAAAAHPAARCAAQEQAGQGGSSNATHHPSAKKKAPWRPPKHRPCKPDDARCVALRDHICDPYFVNVTDKCTFVNTNKHCSEDVHHVAYLPLFYCRPPGDARVFVALAGLLWMAVLFWAMSKVAEDFLVPALEYLAGWLRLAPDVAGVTLFAFASGAPDLFTQIAAVAVGGRVDQELAISATLGAGLFIVAVIMSIVVLVGGKPAQEGAPPEEIADRRAFVRDAVAYLLSLLALLALMLRGTFTAWEAGLLLLGYGAYLATCLLTSRGGSTGGHRHAYLAVAPSQQQLGDGGGEASAVGTSQHGGAQLNGVVVAPAAPEAVMLRSPLHTPRAQVELVNRAGGGQPQHKPLHAHSREPSQSGSRPASHARDKLYTELAAPWQQQQDQHQQQRQLVDGNGMQETELAALVSATPASDALPGLPDLPGLPGVSPRGRLPHGGGGRMQRVLQTASLGLEELLHIKGKSGPRLWLSVAMAPLALLLHATMPALHAGTYTSFYALVLALCAPLFALLSTELYPHHLSTLTFLLVWLGAAAALLALTLAVPPGSGGPSGAAHGAAGGAAAAAGGTAAAGAAGGCSPLAAGGVAWPGSPLGAGRMLRQQSGPAPGSSASGGALAGPCWQACGVRRPRRHVALALVASLQCMLWMSLAADELVALFQAIGRIVDVSQDLLGATVLAWGEAVPELVATLSLARSGQATMAIAAVFGGPIFNVLIAWAGPTLVAALRHHGPMPYRLSPGVGVLVVFTLVVLTFLLAAMPLAFRWRLDRRAAWAVLGIYGVSQVLFLAAEAGGG
ncbi:coiled-coil domain-containing 94-like protein isoform A [Micractinium conductrix]|uniref:Splicing factor YJU2 n=1 Tax=Micractinium conductrix TaxID=554055 RepID=A0A2P6V9S2_9CHLO|nr:coiled-coil domain-containing 94-like protein isoform A [Micractinium conductrix]|eukprot:PSC70828.1 coiled-coil domain-containing 94-like protein isoform A [Micractinium conductrix]